MRTSGGGAHRRPTRAFVALLVVLWCQSGTSAIAAPTVRCTYDGHGGVLTGVAPGNGISVVCTGLAPNQAVTVTEESPRGRSQTNSLLEADVRSTLHSHADQTGAISLTFLVPRRFSARDTAAACPPAGPQVDPYEGACTLAVRDAQSHELVDSAADLVYASAGSPAVTDQGSSAGTRTDPVAPVKSGSGASEPAGSPEAVRTSVPPDDSWRWVLVVGAVAGALLYLRHRRGQRLRVPATSSALALPPALPPLAHLRADASDPAGQSHSHQTAKVRFETPRRDDVVVTFVLPRDVNGQRVAVCGEFNGWSRDENWMHRDGQGRWVARIIMPSCTTYRYRFLVDGTDWINDPDPDALLPNFAGSMDCVIAVGAVHRSANRLFAYEPPNAAYLADSKDRLVIDLSDDDWEDSPIFDRRDDDFWSEEPDDLRVRLHTVWNGVRERFRPAARVHAEKQSPAENTTLNAPSGAPATPQ